MEEWADLNKFPNHQSFHGCHIEYVKNKEVITK